VTCTPPRRAHSTAHRGDRHRARGDRGQIAGIEALPFGFLFFVATVLLVANAWAVVDARMAVAAAAREAARALVEAPPTEGLAVAEARARTVLAAYGRDDADRVRLPEPVVEGGSLTRCARVIVTVEYEVPALVVPFLGGFGDGITASADHSELVDPYRDGDQEGAC
jgi:hypothetical protein